MPTVNLTPSIDTYVNEDAPDSNFSSDTKLVLGIDAPLDELFKKSRVWLKFDVSSIPAGSTINSAVLTLENFYSNNGYNTVVLDCARCSDNTWTTSITWNTAPNGSVGSVEDSFDASGQTFGYIADFSIPVAVADSLASGTLSLRLKYNDELLEFCHQFFHDKDFIGATAPTLAVDYTAPAAGSTGNFFLLF